MQIKIEGKVLCLKKKDIDNLLDRFNPQNFYPVDEWEVNLTSCHICKEYRGCRCCPFRLFTAVNESGCTAVIKKNPSRLPSFYNEKGIYRI